MEINEKAETFCVVLIEYTFDQGLDKYIQNGKNDYSPLCAAVLTNNIDVEKTIIEKFSEYNLQNLSVSGCAWEGE
jgi:hypothetical protein